MYPDDFDNLVIETRSDFEALDSQVKIVWCIYRMEAEINNRGFHQYFSNSSGAYVQETIAALNTIGAPKTQALLVRAVQVGFSSGYLKVQMSTRII